MKKIIKLGACNGKLRPILNKYLNDIGLSSLEENRQVFYSFEMEDYILEIYLLRYADLCNYSDYFDLLLYGEDQIKEREIPNIVNLKYYPQENCRLSLLTTKDYVNESLESLLNKDIATSYPNILNKQYLVPKHRIKEMKGSLEIAPYMDIASVILDIVVTGTSAKLNGLYEAKQLMNIGAYVGTTKRELISYFYELGLLKEDEYGNSKSR